MSAGVARQALRRVRQVALLTLLSLLLLEIVLQVASLVVPSRGGAERAPEDGRKTVLCVGDSFTYGLGASSHEAGAYPAQLQRQLDDAAPSTWRVVNAGFPGRNSRGVLERIDAQLARVRPAFVCILVGLNDRWSHPERLDLSATPSASVSDDRAWRFELRTLRLWKLVLNQFRGETAAAPAWDSDPLHSDPLPALVATLRAGDPALAADMAPGSTAPPAMPSDDEKAKIAALSLQPDAAAENLPRLRAAARACAAQDAKLALRASVIALAWTANVSRHVEELQGMATLDPNDLHTLLESMQAPRALRDHASAAFAARFGWRQADGIWLHPASGEQRALVAIRWEDLGPEALRAFEVHRDHVLQIVTRCRAAGATPLLLGYPNRTSFPDEYLIDVARRAGAEFLSTVTAIEARLAQTPGEPLFVGDGHCNDAGYGLMAERVAARLLAH